MPRDIHAKLIRVKVLLHNHQLWCCKWAGEFRGIYKARILQVRTEEKKKKQLSGLLSFVAWGSITISQEHVIGIGPAKCQIDQVLAGIVCCRVSAPVHSSKCWDPSDSWSEVWTWPAVCSSGVPRLAWLRAACIVHTLLSLSAVPLECKRASHQWAILGLHVFVAVQVQFGVQHQSRLPSYSMQMIQRNNTYLDITACTIKFFLSFYKSEQRKSSDNVHYTFPLWMHATVPLINSTFIYVWLK